MVGWVPRVTPVGSRLSRACCFREVLCWLGVLSCPVHPQQGWGEFLQVLQTVHAGRWTCPLLCCAEGANRAGRTKSSWVVATGLC